ncbi:MAG: hypothetical protein CLLPBCKN_006157 [Chroococcidiopsis cubana SAG 39.79]|uniref:Uncharacterized protein n=1 Tax=Chroococcidiopsis cubana SAG 39.79 TaxID=388085 RepID=A0AB37UG34_9CYAN|nr:hypothetical protein [Chroococcidiopsis cubana]MDZ4876722.1 hypothetical protein [Chroococcidiopsis cubana SAG 39.79]PSB65937.1 hypothetical protein C7B79_03115 [Chroococcidiopsis cubana CCALA 043]RUT10565.1 hypothetical protein DSM107010_41320 [Chroococcidiopsis cubana SAG 39.79]
MTSNLTKIDSLPSIESVLIGGDLSQLSNSDRLKYYSRLCESLGLNALTQPFAYIRLNGKLKLYALREATEQLRKIHHVSVRIQARELVADSIYVVTSQASLPDGRCDESIGAVSIAGLQGEALANAVMKAETKSKRRVTLSICGLAILDETEVDSIPNVQSEQETGRIDSNEANIGRVSRPLASSVCKSWKSPQDAILWAEKLLPHLSMDEIQSEFNLLPATNGKKALAWVERVNSLMLEVR